MHYIVTSLGTQFAFMTDDMAALKHPLLGDRQNACNESVIAPPSVPLYLSILLSVSSLPTLLICPSPSCPPRSSFCFLPSSYHHRPPARALTKGVICAHSSESAPLRPDAEDPAEFGQRTSGLICILGVPSAHGRLQEWEIREATAAEFVQKCSVTLYSSVRKAVFF